MAHVVADRVAETSTSTGTGDFTLAGAVRSFRRFQDVLSTNDTTYYVIEHTGADEWEVGLGTLTAATTLARTTVLQSSNSDNAVNFSAGLKRVFISLPASQAALLGRANAWTGENTFINNSGVKILDTDASHTLGLVVGSNLTANRTWTLTGGDSDRTVSLSGNLTTAAAFTTSGAFALTLTASAATNVTLPTTGTLATLAGSEALSNKTLIDPTISGSPTAGWGNSNHTHQDANSGGTLTNAAISSAFLLAGTETSVSGATTATIGVWHTVTDSGTPAAYTITLPAASGNGGKFIGFRFLSTLTKIVTLDGNSSETIVGPGSRAGALTRKYVGGETCVLLCDGSNWQVVHETMLEIGFSAETSTSQTIATGTDVKVQYGTENWDIGSCYDNATNYRFTPAAPGIYRVCAAATVNALGDGNVATMFLLKNGSRHRRFIQIGSGGVLQFAFAGACEVSMNGSTDYVEVAVRHNVGSDQALNGEAMSNFFQASRVRREES